VESAVELGAFQVWLDETTAALPRIEAALKTDPLSGPLHELMGFQYFAEGKDAEALREFERAVQLNDRLYLSQYFKVMMSPLARSDREEDRRALRAALEEVLLLNPDFPAARVQLARLSIREGNWNAALNYSLQAQRLAPARAGYNTLIGSILSGLGRHAEAAELFRYVADRWEGADREEVIELWQKLPATSQQGEKLVADVPPNGTKVVSGRVASVACSEANSSLNIVVDGQTLVLSRKDYSGGFSDIIWFGGDHFSFCHHLEGLRAVLWYKPLVGAKVSGELTRMEIRAD
jgi:predicted Zn-dependent protease